MAAFLEGAFCTNAISLINKEGGFSFILPASLQNVNEAKLKKTA